MKKRYIIGIMAYTILLFVGVLSVVHSIYRENIVIDGEATVFVHGYKGTENSFGNLLDRFEYTYQWGKKGLVYYISSEGNINDYFLLREEEDQPIFVQVVFENNRAEFAETTEWLSSVLQHLKEEYAVETVNLVGHSMGGIVSTKFSMEYTSVDYPAVNRLVTIGSPFDGIYDEQYFEINQDPAAMDLAQDSPALTELRENNLPVHIQALSIGSTGDLVAEEESVLAVEEVIPKEQLETMIIEDSMLGHSALHENVTVDHMISSFLWENEGSVDIIS